MASSMMIPGASWRQHMSTDGILPSHGNSVSDSSSRRALQLIAAAHFQLYNQTVKSKQWGATAMTSDKIHSGQCFCGTVKFEVSGEPVAMGYCHCESCRHWSAGPVNAFSLWQPSALKVTQGADAIGTYNKTPISFRKWCTHCGGHLFSDHPTMGLVDVYAAMIPSMKFVPGVHVNYQETVLPVHDGKPKMKDMPKEMGGSGVTLPD